jgi:hypothetical protein
MIADILARLQPSDTDTDANITTELEQKNSENASERHLLEFETHYDNDSLPAIGKQVSITIVAGAGTNFLLLKGIESVSMTFNPIPSALAMLAISTMISAATTDKERNFGYNLLMGISKLALNTAVNGSLLGQTMTRHRETVATVESIQIEIDRYEAGYKEPSTDWLMVGGCILLAVIGTLTAIKFYKNMVSK